MFCPKCAENTYVKYTENGIIRRRYRQCISCGYRFFTVEAIDSDSYWDDYKNITKEYINPPKKEKTLFDL